MISNRNFSELNSQNNIMNRSISPSKMTGVQKLTSHIKSTLPQLQNDKNKKKKYLNLKIDMSFKNNSELTSFIEELKSQINIDNQQKMQVKYFTQTSQLLNDQYNDGQLYFLIMTNKQLDWAIKFAKQERLENTNKIHLYVIGLIGKGDFQKRTAVKSKSKLEQKPQYIEYVNIHDEEYLITLHNLFQVRINQLIREEEIHIKKWAQSNKFAGVKSKRRNIHFYYQKAIKQAFTGIYQNYRKKAKAGWLQVHEFDSFGDLLKRLRERDVSKSKDKQLAKKVTSRIMPYQNEKSFIKSSKSLKAMDMVASMRSILDNNLSGFKSNNNISVLNSSIKIMNKIPNNDINIIISQGNNPEIDKLKKLVQTKNSKNWMFWQIQKDSPQFIENMKKFIQEQQKNQAQVEAEQQNYIINAKHLVLLVYQNDTASIQIFNNQQNISNNMELIDYKDALQFSLFLREKVQDIDNFVLAVVPGAGYSVATQYLREINGFKADFAKNQANFQNFKFISSQGRFISQLNIGDTMLGVQSSVNIPLEDISYLQNLLIKRDNSFHPLKGLTGQNVYLLHHESLQSQLKDLQQYINQTARLLKRKYKDQQFLKALIKTLTIKDSVIVITTDDTLREAQKVLQSYENIYILNISDRNNLKKQRKVAASGRKDFIYSVIREIPKNDQFLADEDYNQYNGEEASIQRDLRIMPKNIGFKAGNRVSVRLSAFLKDEQSQKMQIRLRKYFDGDIKIQYYDDVKAIRLLNKTQQPLAFIIWTHNFMQGREDAQIVNNNKLKVIPGSDEELQFLKKLAINENQQLRQEYVIYTKNPLDPKFKQLITKQEYSRFTFVSNRWQKIQQYIIGHYKDQAAFDSIYSDQMMLVFHDDKDLETKDLIEKIRLRKNNDMLNPANRIQIRLIDDFERSLLQESPYNKYYVILNENKSKYKRQNIVDIIKKPQFKDYYAKILLIKDSYDKKIQNVDGHVRKSFLNYKDMGAWLCKTTVKEAQITKLKPKFVIDNNSINYMYFLNKYEQLTRRDKFSYEFVQSKQKLLDLVNKNARPLTPIWIIVKDLKSYSEYLRILQKNQKSKYVRFIYQGSNGLLKDKMIFRNSSKKQVQKFILNFFKREKQVFSPSSTQINNNNIALFIMKNNFGNPIVRKQHHEVEKWQKILGAKIQYISSSHQLFNKVNMYQNYTIYLIAPYGINNELTKFLGENTNIKKIYLANKDEYNHRDLNQDKVTKSKEELFIGNYSAQITEYLLYLRYNIRRPQQILQKNISQEIIELYLQKQYRLSQQDVTYLTAKNDSLIINYNGFDSSDLLALLKRAENYNYRHIFIVGPTEAEIIRQYNKKNKKQHLYINVEAPNGPNKISNSDGMLLQCNQMRQVLTLVTNLPQNRYTRAQRYKGKIIFYINPNDSQMRKCHAMLKTAQIRNPNIIIRNYSDLNLQMKRINENCIFLISDSQQKDITKFNNPYVSYVLTDGNYDQRFSYNSQGNKLLKTKKQLQTNYFVYQMANNGDFTQQIPLRLDQFHNLFNNIRTMHSQPINVDFSKISFFPPFKAIPQNIQNNQIKINRSFVPPVFQVVQETIKPVQMMPNTIDSNIPQLLNQITMFPKVDLPPQPLSLQVLQKIRINIIRPEQPVNITLPQAPPAILLNKKIKPDFSLANATPIDFSLVLPRMKAEQKIQVMTIRIFDAPPKEQMLHSPNILILVPTNLVHKYQNLQGGHVQVQPYSSRQKPAKYLHSQNTFIYLITTPQDYPLHSNYAKISPGCTLIVDSNRDLTQEDIYKLSLEQYCSYFGNNGPQYLADVIPNQPIPPYRDRGKYLYYDPSVQNKAFDRQYQSYDKIFYKDWNQLYWLITNYFKGRHNVLLKSQANGQSQLVNLQPVVYLQNKQYMKDFKNKYNQGGYLNQQKPVILSNGQTIQFSTLPQVYYNDQNQLARMLQNQQTPCVVLYNSSKNGRIRQLKRKFPKHKWVSTTNFAQRWINIQGLMMQVTDIRLKRKQDLFASMFNREVFDAFNDMKYLYLSNKSQTNQNRNIYFSTKERLLEIYHAEPNLLMVLFVELKDLRFVPQLIMAEANDPSGRVKLILIDTQFIDSETTLHIKYNQIDPVIRHINEMDKALRIDYIIYHATEGERPAQTLIQTKKLSQLDYRTYGSIEDIDYIGQEIKGKYKKVYVVCFEQQKNQISQIFNKYSIKDKGIVGEGVEFHLIPRKSVIAPNLSYISKQSNIYTNHKQQKQRNNSLINSLQNKQGKQSSGSFQLLHNSRANNRSNGANKISSYQAYINSNNEAVQGGDIPKMNSRIKAPSKLQTILKHKQVNLKISQQLRYHFPSTRLFGRQVYYQLKQLQSRSSTPQIIITKQLTPDIMRLSKENNNAVVLISNQQDFEDSNIIVVEQGNIPQLIKRLQSGRIIEETNQGTNIDQYKKVRILYDKSIDQDILRRILLASRKNAKIFPIQFKDTREVRKFLNEPDSLLLVMMQNIPQKLKQVVQRENKTIVKKKKVKIVLPKKSDSQISGLSTILQQQIQEQGVKLLTHQELAHKLKIHEQKQKHDEDEQNNKNNGNLLNLNVNSNIDFTDQENEIERLRHKLNGELIVLIVDNNKRVEVDKAITNFNVLIQGYTNATNLQNDIRDRKDNLKLAVVGYEMLDKVPQLKNKYPNCEFILQKNGKYEDIQYYRPYITAQINKIDQIELIIGKLSKQNDKVKHTITDSIRTASKYDNKKMSTVVLSNYQRFANGYNNQSLKKANIFYKVPQNEHIKTKLKGFNNLNCIPYKNASQFKNLIGTYNTYLSVLIANQNQIQDLEDFITKKKDMVYVIRFEPPYDIKDNPKVKKLFSTYKKQDLENFLIYKFQKNMSMLQFVQQSNYVQQINEGKKYKQTYVPTLFGTAPRFAGDNVYVPPKNKQSTYTKRTPKSNSANKPITSRLQSISSRGYMGEN